MITELEKRGADVAFHDPYVAELDHHGATASRQPWMSDTLEYGAGLLDLEAALR